MYTGTHRAAPGRLPWAIVRAVVGPPWADLVRRKTRMEYISSELSVSDINAYLGAVPSLLASLGHTECNVSYGWMCELPVDELWQAHKVAIDELSGFVAAAVAGGIYKPGASDLFIESIDGQTLIKICHESDVHVASPEASLATLLAPIASHHPDFSYKLDNVWKTRSFSGGS